MRRPAAGRSSNSVERILKLIDEKHVALGARSTGRTIAARGEVSGSAKVEAITPGPEPSTKTRYYVSYAWNDDTPGGPDREAFVDRLCAETERQDITIIRDKTAMKYGDSISKFMQAIGRGDRIFIVLSEKYLKSAYCMQELFNVWRNCCEDEAKFVAGTRVFVLPCAKIKTMKQRTDRAKYWRNALQKMEKLEKQCRVLDMSDKDIADYRSMSDFANKTADILYLVQYTLRPPTFDEFVKYGFDAPPPR